MPTISTFFGITIRMYIRDHMPPHFHAAYAEHEAQIEIATGEVLSGRLPRAARHLVKEWCELHRNELMENWHRRDTGEQLEGIPGLDDDQGD